MAMSKEQKKELIEAAVVVVAVAILFYLFRNGGSGIGPIGSDFIDTTPYGTGTGASGAGDGGSGGSGSGDGGGPASITYNYPQGSDPRDPSSPIAPASADVAFGFGPTDIGGNIYTGGSIGGNGVAYGGIDFGGGPSYGDVGGSDFSGGGYDTTFPDFPGILGNGANTGGSGGAGGAGGGCGCCNSPAASGDAFPTFTNAVDDIQRALPPRAPTAVRQNPYNFYLKPFEGGPALPPHSVQTLDGSIMSLTNYNAALESANGWQE